MKKEQIQTQIKKIKSVVHDTNISSVWEILRLSDISSIYWSSKTNNTEKYFVINTVLKSGIKDINTLGFHYKSPDDIDNRVKKILYFMAMNKDNLDKEFLVVFNDGVYLSSELDFSQFNPDIVTK